MIEGQFNLCHLRHSSLYKKTTVTSRVKSTTTAGLVMALAAVLFSGVVTAGSFDLCGPALLLPARPAAEMQTGGPDFTHVSADDADIVELGTSVLTGNVQVLHGERQLQADRVELTQPENTVDAFGDIRIWDENLFVTGETAHIEIDAETAVLEQSQFIMLDEHAHGVAERVVLNSRDLITVEDGLYTTCNPDAVAWQLEADSIVLNRVNDSGLARNVLVKFKGVPVFYSPILTFPLSDKRKTGFLTPSYRVSSETGVEFLLPYYWNIAPSQDATLTARAMTQRGVQLQGEYRYLTNRGHGKVGVEYLPHDSELGEDRSAVSFQHDGTFAPGWSTDIDFNWVSDEAYFEDLGTNLETSSQSFLQQQIDLRYSRNRWSLLARVQDYQTIDHTITAANKPYKRLPQLLFNYSSLERNRELTTSFRGEVVHFDRTDPSVTGIRYDLKPSVSFPMRTASTFLVPKAELQYTAYQLDGQESGLSDNPDRLLPILSADAGMFFERDVQFGGERFVQTLEPRLYYLYVPFDDQSDIPLFDTSLNTFNFGQLFRENRFSGADRTGDANQLSLVLSSRLLTGSGAESLRASVGQIVYFRDRKVNLTPTSTEQTDGASDFVAELSAKVWDGWRVTAGMQWNVADSRTDRNTIRVRYQPNEQRVINLEYRFVREVDEQTDASFRWPINYNWSAVGRWNYSLPTQRTLEAFGGVEYDSCCWAARAVAGRFVHNTAGDSENAVFLQFELKGLAGVGDSVATFLQKSIPGYRNNF
jgi:LPS-assembly protein